MAICSFVTALNVFGGFLISECSDNDYFYCDSISIHSIVIISSLFCGTFDSTLWVTYKYIFFSQVIKKLNKVMQI